MAGPTVSRSERVPARVAALLMASVAVVADGGCSFVPKSKVDECHRLTQTLRADNTRLKDVTADLRSQNQDFSQRAVDDARKIAAQEEAVERLETSVTAYQVERDQLATAFEAIKRRVRLAASPQPSASLEQRLHDFAGFRKPAGWTYDATTGILSAATDALFEPNSARLTAKGSDELKALGDALEDSVPDGQGLEVVGHPGVISEGVRKAGFTPGEDAEGDDTDASPAPGRFLAAARAARFREALTGEAGLDPGRVRLAPPAQAQAEGGLRVELRAVTKATHEGP